MSASPLAHFIAELRRRRVFRVAAFYGGIAFVIVQIIDGTFEVMGIPAWVSRLLITLLALGFPVAMGLAWIFDITPEGIVRTEGRPTGKPGTSNRALIAVTIAAVAFGIWGRWGGGTAPSGSDTILIAVLPFDNYSEQKEEWLADGITDNITAQLTGIRELAVIGRTSVMQYKATTKRLNVIGRELGVDYLLEGSVQKIGGKIRIVTQLIDARTEQPLWAESYDREVAEADIFVLQTEVARRIAEALRVTLSPSESARLERQPTRSVEAYNLYLQGYHFWNKRTGRDLEAAKKFFQQAIDADPLYAQAYIGLADTYNLMDQYSNVSRDEAYPQAKAAALKALEIDSGLAEAHTSLAYVAQSYAWDFEEAEREFLLALELNPNYATGLQWYAELLTFLGRFDEAIPYIEAAHELDPLSPIIATVRSWIYYCDEQYMAARQQFERALDLHPGFPMAAGLLTLHMLQSGQTEEWLDLLAEDHSRYGPNLKAAAELRQIWEQNGIDALILETGLGSQAFNAEGSQLYAESVASMIAQKPDALLAQLEEGFEARLFWTLFLAAADPGVRALLGNDSRYHELLTRMGLD